MPAEKLLQPRLDQLGVYPLERLQALFDGHIPDSELAPTDATAELALRLKAVRV